MSELTMREIRTRSLEVPSHVFVLKDGRTVQIWTGKSNLRANPTNVHFFWSVFDCDAIFIACGACKGMGSDIEREALVAAGEFVGVDLLVLKRTGATDHFSNTYRQK